MWNLTDLWVDLQFEFAGKMSLLCYIKMDTGRFISAYVIIMGMSI